MNAVAIRKDKDDAEIQRVFEELFKTHDALNYEEKRYIREGFKDDKSLAVFDLLSKTIVARLVLSYRTCFWQWVKPVFFDKLVGFISVFLMYFGVTNQGLSLRLYQATGLTHT